METVGLVGAMIVAVAAIYYVYDIVFGSTRPHSGSWAVWLLVSLLGYWGSEEGGAGTGAYVALVYLVLAAVTLALSVTKRFGSKGVEHWSDRYIGMAAIIAIVLWRFGDLPADFASGSAIVAEGLAFWFTLRKAWHEPLSESIVAWTISVLGSSLGAAAAVVIGHGKFAAAGYPLYLAISDLLLTLLLWRGWWQSRHKDRAPGVGAM